MKKTTPPSHPLQDAFRRFAEHASLAVGSPWAFVGSALIVLVWAVTGPLFGFSDTWQLIINTGTTVLTFLMIFLVQNTQNRDNRVVQLKLDELLRGVVGARTGLVNLESLTDDQLEELQRQFVRLQARPDPPPRKTASKRRPERLG